MAWYRCSSCGLNFNKDRTPNCPKCGGPPATDSPLLSSGGSKSALTREVGPTVYKVLSFIPALLGAAGIVLGVTQMRLGFIVIGFVFLGAAWKWWNGERA